MAADCVTPFSAAGAVDAGLVGGWDDLAASIHVRRVLVVACWSSRAEADVKVKVWFSCAEMRIEALEAAAGVCWRSVR
jgi:hypothetical protein